MSSRCIRHEPCPKCRSLGRDRSGNNLGVFDDGHKYCFACGYTTGGTNRIPKEELRGKSIRHFPLPDDVDSTIDARALDWLYSYDLTAIDIINNKLLWSPYWQQLIFPYFGESNQLLGWQGRSFLPKDDPRYRKWYSQGQMDSIFHIIPPKREWEYKGIVLVEDIVSAIKVGKVAPCMPVFTSTAKNRLKTLSRLTTGLVWWLDPNMKKKALQEANYARSCGFNASVVWSEVDPKEHSHEDIKKYLTEDRIHDILFI